MLKEIDIFENANVLDIIYPASIVMPQRYTLIWAKQKKLPNCLKRHSKLLSLLIMK